MHKIRLGEHQIPVKQPASNAVRQDIIEAVRAGRFHVYPIESIDEGISVLTGVEAGEGVADLQGHCTNEAGVGGEGREFIDGRCAFNGGPGAASAWARTASPMKSSWMSWRRS